MARIKQVFSSHAQLAHVWAQQTQAAGRTSNMFFEGTDIYSYGHHYLAARIYVVKGKRFALVRSDAYSPSTAKHLYRIRGARVPLREALALYRAIKSGRDVRGYTIGQFELREVAACGDDTLLTVGCHRILLSEAAAVLGPVSLEAV